MQFIIDQHTCSSETFQLSAIPSVDPLSSGTNTKPNSKKNYELIFQSIFLTLNHNTWFKSFNFDNISKNLERSLNHFFQGLRWNQTVAKISLRNLSFALSEDSLISFRNSLVNNDLNNLQILDFSETTLGGHGAEHIAVALESMNHGFKALRIQNCGISGKGLKAIFVALCRNFGMSLHLVEVDCSNNKFDELSSRYLMSFLEKSAANNGSLKVLKLSNTGKLDVAGVVKAIKGLKNLTELDLSANKIEDVISTVNPPATKEPAEGDYAVALLSSALISIPIQHLRLSDCSLTGESTGRILTALLRTKFHQSGSLSNKISVDISENEYKDKDATVITEALMGSVGGASGRIIESLNLSGSKFKDKGLIMLFQGIPLLNSVRTLILDRAIDSSWSLSKTAAKTPVLKKKDLKVAPVKPGEKKPKKKVYLDPEPIQIQTPTENIASALGSLTAGANPLKHLSLSGPGYRYIINSYLSSAGVRSPCTLDELDLSCNGLGDSGAMVVAEFLRGNSQLKGLNIDRNGIGTTGYLAILSTLMYNHTLQYFRYPVFDYDASFSGSSVDWSTTNDGKHINTGGKSKLKETLYGIERAIESNSVAARGYFDVAAYINHINSDHIGTWGTLWGIRSSQDDLGDTPPPAAETSDALKEYSKTVDPESIRKPLSKEEKKLVEAQSLVPTSDDNYYANTTPSSSTSSSLSSSGGAKSSAPGTPNVLHSSVGGTGVATGVSPSSTGNEIVKEGHVNFMAKGGITKSWSVRYAVLERSKSNINRAELFVWKDFNEARDHIRLKAKPKYKIDLYLAKVKPLDTPGISKSPFGVEIHTRSKTFYIMTEDKTSMHDWLFALQNEQSGAIDSGVTPEESKKFDGTKSLSVETTSRFNRSASMSTYSSPSIYGSSTLASPRATPSPNTAPVPPVTSNQLTTSGGASSLKSSTSSSSSLISAATPDLSSNTSTPSISGPSVESPAVPYKSKPVRKTPAPKSNLPSTHTHTHSSVPLPSAPPFTPLPENSSTSSVVPPPVPPHPSSTTSTHASVPSTPSAPKPSKPKSNASIDNAQNLDALLDAHYDFEGLSSTSSPSPSNAPSVFTQSTRKHTQKSNLDDLLTDAELVESNMMVGRNNTLRGENKVKGGTVYQNFYAMENPPPPAPKGKGPPVPKVRDWIGVKKKEGGGEKNKKEEERSEDLGSQLMSQVVMRRGALKEDEYVADSDDEGWESD